MEIKMMIQEKQLCIAYMKAFYKKIFQQFLMMKWMS